MKDNSTDSSIRFTTASEQHQYKEDMQEMLLGMKLACLSVTDDKPNSLKKIAKANPWHQEALKLITGSQEQAHRPLTDILMEEMGLTLDAHIDVSGITKGGHFLDTQGYIAHNATSIVVSYRCTTSVYDWLTNLNTTASVWEIEEDYEQGFSGYCSGLDCFCVKGERPRVHTGFYNNFLASLPLIKKHIEPMLGPGQPPRTLYVTGHSLGAGVATMAACYFLLEFDWNLIPQRFCCVTAGSPRSCGSTMRDIIDERIHQFNPRRVRLYRLVKGKDIVATVPPKALNFRHISQAVTIDDHGIVTMPIPRSLSLLSVDQSMRDSSEEDIQRLVQTIRPIEIDDENNESVNSDSSSKYDKLVAKVPVSLRDHMPDFYLKPLLRVNGVCNKTATKEAPVLLTLSPAPPEKVKSTKKMMKRILHRKTATAAN